jgi:hypothetical protein
MENFDYKKAIESGDVKDRRVHHNLRQMFDNACRVTAPFFDPAQSWGGSPLTMYARQTLCDSYPELTQQEIAILFSSVVRFHKGAVAKAPEFRFPEWM